MIDRNLKVDIELLSHKSHIWHLSEFYMIIHVSPHYRNFLARDNNEYFLTGSTEQNAR